MNEPIPQGHPIRETDLDNIQLKQKIPPKTINGKKIKIKSYSKIREQYKLQNQKIVFLEDLKIILSEFKPQDYQLDDEVLVEILNIAEEYFYMGDKDAREKLKQSSVRELMLPYFMNNELILEKAITNVYHKVTKSNWVKRSWRKFKAIFEKKKD
jgi:hypothetical protein